MKKNIIIILITTVLVSLVWQLILVQKINAERKYREGDYSDCARLERRHQDVLKRGEDYKRAVDYLNKMNIHNQNTKREFANYLWDKEYFAMEAFKSLFNENLVSSADILCQLGRIINPNRWTYTFDRNIAQNSFVEEPVAENPLDALPYLIATVPRDGRFIDGYVTEVMINKMADWFAASNLRQSGGENLMRALHLAYDEVKNKPTVLEGIYQRAIEDHTLYDTNYYHIASEDVAKLLFADHNINEQGEYDDIVHPLSKLALVYGFWARRHHEGNKTEVYSVLNRFVNRVDAYKGEE
jgi:hypothetical protein